jgi:uncharacterized membrane protein YdcZ (DUF606 family)
MSSGIVVAVLVGVGIALQVSIVGRAAGGTNPLAISLALQLSGVMVAAVWATSRGSWPEVLAIGRYWWWIPLGVGGWIVVAALGFAAHRIGVAPTLALSIAAQLVAGLIIDAVART